MKPPDIEKFIAAGRVMSGASLAQFLGHQRRFAKWRQASMAAAYEAGLSSPHVGRAFNRDHTTVLYAHKMHKDTNEAYTIGELAQ